MPELSPFWQMEKMRRSMLRKQHLRDVAERAAFKKRRKEARREEFAQQRDILRKVTYLKAQMRKSKSTPTGIQATGFSRGLGFGRTPMRAGRSGTVTTGGPFNKMTSGFRRSREAAPTYTPPESLRSGSVERSGRMWTTSGYVTEEGERDVSRDPSRTIRRRRRLSTLGASFGLGGHGRVRARGGRYGGTRLSPLRTMQGTRESKPFTGKIRETFIGF